MTENSVREKVGGLLILLHFAILSLLIGVYFVGGFLFEEFTTSFAIITPMFAGYTTVIVIHFIQNRIKSVDQSSEVTLIFIILSTVFPICFFAAISLCILLFATGQVFENFEEFKGTLGLMEVVFAAYVANFVYSLFEKNQPDRLKHSVTKN